MSCWIYCCLLLSLFCSGCATTYSNGSGSHTLSEPTMKPEQLMEKVIKVKTTLTSSGSSAWRVDEMRVPGRETLRSVSFLDSDLGWAGGKGVLYRTNDGGASWLPVEINLPNEAFITQILFLSKTIGWLVIQKEATSPLTYHDNYFRLLRTTDGGTTWKTQLEDKDSVVKRIRLSEDREAWLIGLKYTSLEPLRAHDFIMHSSDLGESWKDVSDPLNEVLRGIPIKVEFTDALPDGPGGVSILLPRGGVFKTQDAGQTWHQQNGTIDDSSYACSCHLGVIDNHRTWIGGDKDDSHSVLGMVAIRDPDSWREYIVFGVSFSDILFLSRDRILTCGSTTPKQQGYTEKRGAVISYSSDGATSWSFVYDNPKASKVNALAVVDPNHVWAVGEGGLILRLTATTVTN
jgi:photosystem II stability/assembly factor-like uncharacterized protein